MPELGVETQVFLRTAYGVLLLITVLRLAPHARRFLLGERWGGYAASGPYADALHNPIALRVVLPVWVTLAVLLILGVWTVPAALLNLLLCRYYFVGMRWKGIHRGMGAPGYMTYWLGGAVFLLALTTRHAPELRALALLVVQVDFAFIFLSAGVYKLASGYARNEGMELGMANPAWGYWWRTYARLPHRHWVFRTFNQAGWSSEILAAVLMLVPATRFLGAMLILLGFGLVATQIRLATLAWMVMLCCVVFVHPGSAADVLIGRLVPGSPEALATGAPLGEAGTALLRWALVAYLVLLPLAHAGLSYNFYGKRPLPGLLQKALERFTNFFGLIVWRVFSADLIDFVVRIYRQPREGGARVLLSNYGEGGVWGAGSRFTHVVESITVCCVFTTLRYYPSDSDIFRERLLRYARTLPRGPDEVVVFEYVIIRKGAERFEFVPAVEYVADPEAGTIQRRPLAEGDAAGDTHRFSPVHEAGRPGSYVPRAAASHS